MGQVPAVLIEDAPEFEWRDGLFYATDPSGTRAIRPHAFFKGFRRMGEAIRDYHAETGAEIIEFPGASAA